MPSLTVSALSWITPGNTKHLHSGTARKERATRSRRQRLIAFISVFWVRSVRSFAELIS